MNQVAQVTLRSKVTVGFYSIVVCIALFQRAVDKVIGVSIQHRIMQHGEIFFIGSFSEKFIAHQVVIAGTYIIPKQIDFSIRLAAPQVFWGCDGNINTRADREGIGKLAQHIAIADGFDGVVIKAVAMQTVCGIGVAIFRYRSCGNFFDDELHGPNFSILQILFLIDTWSVIRSFTEIVDYVDYNL